MQLQKHITKKSAKNAKAISEMTVLRVNSELLLSGFLKNRLEASVSYSRSSSPLSFNEGVDFHLRSSAFICG